MADVDFTPDKPAIDFQPEQKQEGTSVGQKIAAGLGTAIRIGGGALAVVPELGEVTPAAPLAAGIGAAVTGGTDILAQAVERIGGARKSFSLPEAGVAAAAGAIPLGRLAQLGFAARAAIRSAQGAAIGAGATEATSLLERGELAPGQDVAESAAIGGAFGAGAEGLVRVAPTLRDTIFGKAPAEPGVQAVQAEQAAREVIPSATEERKKPESNQPEHTGNAPSGPPAEPIGRGGDAESREEPQATIAAPAPEVGRVDVMKLAEEQQGKAGEPVEEIKGKEDDAERQGEGQRREGLLEPSPAAEIPPTPSAVESTEPEVSGIANRIVQEKVARGEVGEVAPGQGTSVNELRQRGLAMSPEEINQHVSDVMSGTGDIVRQGEALTAEEARLSQRSNELSRESEADPTNMEKKLAADNAFKDVTDFHNGPVAQLKMRWSDAGRTLQGEIPVDLSTFNGLREAWLKDIGSPPPPEVEPTLRNLAQQVNGANGEANASLAKVGESIGKVTKSRKIPSAEQVRENILQRLRERTPCK